METVAGASRALNLLLVAANDGRLEEICERFNVRVMSAFGSATRSDVKDPNDLDIGVSFRRNLDGLVRPAGLQLRIDLWTALVDLTEYENVDLVVLDIDNPVLRAEALTGVPLYESVRGEYAEAQIASVGEKRDTAGFRRRNLELMAQ